MKARSRAPSRCRPRRAPLRARRRPPMRGPMRRKAKPAAPRKKRVKAPIIPDTSKGTPPSYFELLQEAVLTLKDAGKGVSLPEIRRQLQRRYKGRFDKAGNKLLTTAIQRLAERGNVIYKKGYRYCFNSPKRPKPSPSDAASASSCSSTSRSSATSDATDATDATSAPSDATDATAVDSRTSASSSTSGTNRSGKSSVKDGAALKGALGEPKDAARNVDGEGKSTSGDDLSSSAASASSTASRRASSKKS